MNIEPGIVISTEVAQYGIGAAVVLIILIFALRNRRLRRIKYGEAELHFGQDEYRNEDGGDVKKVA